MRRFAALIITLMLMLCTGCGGQTPAPSAPPSATSGQSPAPSADDAVTPSSGTAAPSTMQPTAQGFELHVLDVGKADCLLLACDGLYMLVDTGEKEDEQTIRDYLTAQGVTRLELLVATHPDKDHIGGMPWVLREYDVAQAWICPLSRESDPYMSMMVALSAEGTPVEHPMAGYAGSLGSATIEVLSPNDALLADGDKNECSLVLRVTYGQTRFLLMADAQKDAEQYLLDSGRDLSADVLKVGHHGSDKATTRKLLRAVNAEYAVISGNNPDSDTLDKLSEEGAIVLRTDVDGTVVFRSDGESISVRTEHSEAQAA